jgi:2-polyprenyl-3-methyl-5-hydroxy-6-metoxy-1,4-benzoquinol methylase
MMLDSARSIEAEWLDVLRPDDPRAIRSRNDLRRINVCMLQHAIMAKTLLASRDDEPIRTILDLGAGDGTFMLRVARRLAPRWRDVTVILLDRLNIVSEETRRHFRSLRWNVEILSADVLGFLDQPNIPTVDVVTANLFLHHFPAEQLERLLTQIAKLTRLFVACEPRRAPRAMLASRMLWAIGCNDVSRHDAVVSVQAGFSGQELSELWPKQGGWEMQEQPAWLFTHCFAAHFEGTTT